MTEQPAPTSFETIQTADPRAGYLAFKDEIDAAVMAAMGGRSYSLGPIVETFEAAFAAYCGVAQGIGVNSGTDAIHLALRGLGIGAGDEVITVSHTAVATVAAIEMSGARPVMVDVDPNFCTIDPDAVTAAIGPRTRAVVAVHLYGQPADMTELAKLCSRFNLALVEDCAQAHGARWRDRPVGSLGSASCFSFYPTKNLGAIGDAGMVLTDDAALAERIRRLRQYGWEKPQHSVVPGWNSRLGPLQAAILNTKLKHLDAMVARRRAIAERYCHALAELPIKLPHERAQSFHAYHLFVLRMPDRELRDLLRDDLARHGVIAGIHYPTPVHLQPAYAGRAHPTLANSEHLAATVLSLPLYPELTEESQDRVISAVRGFRGRP